MTIYDLKPAFQNLLRPLAASLVRRGISANQVTIAAFALSLAQAVLVALTHGAVWALALMPLTLFVRMALNAMDGIMAKEFGQKSALGAYLNELFDLLSDAALYLSMAFMPGVSLWGVTLFTLTAAVSEYAGVLGWALTGRRRYEGPFGKSDRAFFLGVAALLAAVGWTGSETLSQLFYAGAILGTLTAINRVKGGLR